MSAKVTSLSGVHDVLKQRSEYDWGDFGPVEMARLEQVTTYLRVTGRRLDRFLEKPAVDVLKSVERGRQVGHSLFLVEHVKQISKP